MRGGSSIRQHKEGIETDIKVVNKDEPHLSGAYIRSLVKQLTSSRTKDPMDPKHPSPPAAAAKLDRKGLSGGGENQQAQQPPPHKKQVRRRLHTSRPYQERLLNMAEARREIVTALKYHRAAMKQANEQQQQQQQHQQQPVEGGKDQLPCYEQEPKVKSRRNPRTYPSSSAGNTNFCNNNYHHYVDNSSSSSNNLSHPLPPPPSCSFPWTNSPILPPPPIVGGETLNFPLPNQPLGLNLNIQDFNNIDTSTLLYHNNSPSTSPCFSFTNNAASEEVPNLQFLQSGVAVPPAPCSDDGFHHVLDDEEMAEMRSIGEQHQVEWNDTMNLVTSAWWFKFMKTVDLGPDDQLKAVVADDEIMEFPPWFNPANDATLLQQQHYYDCPQDYYSPDPTLPCMDIGEIEGMEGEWWA
ncbi:unnamed protein product [Linum trigynum]|uniref:Hydroxyproline-rich glycoprotein family protein n=1 Tax=Linum trigynum TaxID=586398 RepID=A0AAV2EWU2_9ROSI